MIFPHSELRFINEQIGFGVFATKLIPMGSITWASDDLDQILDSSFVQSLDSVRSELVRKYSYRNREGKYVLCWDIGRYVNHSFHANCITTAYDFDIAIRNIHPGEQLTNDYGLLNLDEPFDCYPEEGTDRTRALKDDILNYYREWDEMVLQAFTFFEQVEQPLSHLIPPACKKRIKMAVEKQVVIDSTKTLYYDDQSKDTKN
ncbi:MAG: SET domain-containing protein [Paenibacillaceae bacterium]